MSVNPEQIQASLQMLQALSTLGTMMQSGQLGQTGAVQGALDENFKKAEISASKDLRAAADHYAPDFRLALPGNVLPFFSSSSAEAYVNLAFCSTIARNLVTSYFYSRKTYAWAADEAQRQEREDRNDVNPERGVPATQMANAQARAVAASEQMEALYILIRAFEKLGLEAADKLAELEMPVSQWMLKGLDNRLDDGAYWTWLEKADPTSAMRMKRDSEAKLKISWRVLTGFRKREEHLELLSKRAEERDAKVAASMQQLAKEIGEELNDELSF